MKERALSENVPVFQPLDINTPESISDLKELNADLAVVAAYGQILSAEIIESPRLGSINLHASLLPKFRGAAPVQYAIWKGEHQTGVTIFQIEPRLDAGEILGVVETPIGPKECSGELAERISQLAVPLTLDVLHQIENSSTDRIKQDPADVTKAPRLRKDDGRIDWNESAAAVDCRIRAMQPWPKASSFLHAEGQPPLRLIILDVDVTEASQHHLTTPSGTILEVAADRCVVCCQQGLVSLRTVQPEGKRPMSIEDFLRGHSVAPGDHFSTDSQ